MNRKLVAVLVALALVGGACGDDDDDTTAGPSTDGEQAAGDSDADPYCDHFFELRTFSDTGPDVDFETATEEEIAAAVAEFGKGLEPLLKKSEELAPEEIQDATTVLVGASRTALAENDDRALHDPAVQEAENEVTTWVVDNCEGVTATDVTAVDYAFNGAPETIETGRAIMTLTNEGTEMHEMIVLRKKDTTTESFEDLLALPQEEAQQKVDFAGAAFAPPGTDASAVVELTAGEYIMICFIPVGSTPEAGEEVDGPPHFTEGMLQKFTVS